MENTNFVMFAKKFCSQINNRSSMAASASVKNTSSQHGQSRSVHGAFHVRPDDSSKLCSQFPVTSERNSCHDTATVSTSTPPNMLLNASLLKVSQQNGHPVRENFVYARPDVRFIQQASYCDRQLGSNAQGVAMSSDLISPSSTSVKKQSLLLKGIEQLEFGNSAHSSADFARNVILRSLLRQDPSVCENTDINIHHGRYVVSHDINGPENFDFLPVDARSSRANLCASVPSQVLDNTPGTLQHKQSQVPSKVPRSSEISNKKLENPERGSFRFPSAPASESDGQVSNGLNVCHDNQLSRPNHLGPDQKINRVNNPSANVRTHRMKNLDTCELSGLPSDRTSSLLVEPAADNDLFDMFGAEFNQFAHNSGADLVTWSGAESQNSDRNVPESSIYPNSSPLFSSLDNELHYSGMFSLTETDQLLDAVISNIHPSGKECPNDSASCKTALTDVPSTSHLGPTDLKLCESSGIPSVSMKHESAHIVKQPCVFEKPEDGCHSQNNGMHKSQIHLWIESGQNMKCESASASNSKGVDTSSKANRKRSRPGESSKPRPKDRQLIQDRIKELRELVPNGAKVSSCSLSNHEFFYGKLNI